MGFYVYKSSAGSGKTFTLVRAYLRIALATDNAMEFKHILAMTFTNKAAQEMSDRILLMLREMAKPNNSGDKGALQMRQFLAEDLEISEERIARRAEKTLGAILHNYSEFSVSTIDSFVHRIIRAFASEMELSQNFDLELNHAGVMQRAVNLLVDDVGVNKALTQFLQEFARDKVSDGKSWNIKSDLYKFANQLGNTHNTPYFDKAAEIELETYLEVRKKYQKDLAALGKQITDLAQPILDLLLSASRVESEHANRQIFLKFIRNTAKGQVVELKPAAFKIGSGGKLHAAKVDAATKAKFEEITDEVHERFSLLTGFIDQIEAEFHLKSTVVKKMHYTALIGEVNKKVKQIKAENNLVLINEFTKLVGNVTQSEPVPFIYEKLGIRYKHLLFDEHQDTSLSQWQNMLALVQNSLSAGGSSLVVGDAKQSIYRWRGGEVGQFQQLPQPYNPLNAPFIEEWNATLEQAYTYTPPLQTNYRSKANVVNFNNHLFRNIANGNPEVFGGIYDEVEQTILAPESGGVVEAKFLLEDTGADELRNELAEEIVNPIKRAHADGYDYKEIAVLTRGKKTNPTIVETLQKNGIPVISSESLLVTNSDAVLLLEAMLSHICDPTSTFFMQQAAIYFHKMRPQLGFDSWMFAFKKIPQETLGDKHKRQQKFYTFLLSCGVHLDYQKMATLPLYELISYFIIQFNLSSEDNKLATFCQYAFEFALKSGVTVYDFMEDWRTKKEELSIQMPEDFDAVNLLTVHKSKGLDWPVVIMFNVNDTKKHYSLWENLPKESEIPVGYLSENELKLIGNTQATEHENKMLELDYINLMYVGFTRAADRLHIFGSLPYKYQLGKYLEHFENLGDQLGFKLQFGKYETGRKHKVEKEAITSFTYGTFNPKEEDEHDASATDFFTLQNQRNTLYQQKLKVKKNYLSRLSASNEIDFGNIVHKGFSYVHGKSDIPSAINQLLMNGDISKNESEEIEHIMQQVAAQSDIAHLFEDGLEVRTEAEIVLATGETLIPDRVVITPTEVAVVDFKTGMPNGKYVQQIQGYKKELGALGYENVKGYLMYTSTNQVEMV